MLGCTAIASGKPRTTPVNQPNIVVVMTDDQDAGSVAYMPNVMGLAAEGVTFANSIVNFPLCCPSRATYLTGQYASNHGVMWNSPPKGGFLKLDHSNTLPIWLQRAGYHTGHVGEYLSGYGYQTSPYFVPGWNEFVATIGGGTYVMHQYKLFENGVIAGYGNGPTSYQTDVLARHAEEFVRRRAPLTQPFFLSVMPVAPHLEFTQLKPNPRPAPRHVGAFANVPLPIKPSFNEEEISDKPGHMRAAPPIDDARFAELTDRYRSRLESLLAVDEMVGRLVRGLREAGELDNTVIVFTSDNGYLLGEHRQEQKVLPYEESIRVPLIIRGPGAPPGTTRSQLVANVDLAPTLLDYAGATAGHKVDGISLRGVMARPKLRPTRAIALHSSWIGSSLIGVRTPRYKYVRWSTGEEELYDLRRDPFELTSLHASKKLKPQRRYLRELSLKLRKCEGRECGEESLTKARLKARARP